MQTDIFNSARFNGSDYIPEVDDKRLRGQIKRVWECMKDERWRTLNQISIITGDPEASISAQLRHLRKARFGGHIILKRNMGDREKGLFEYQLVINNQPAMKEQQTYPIVWQRIKDGDYWDASCNNHLIADMCKINIQDKPFKCNCIFKPHKIEADTFEEAKTAVEQAFHSFIRDVTKQGGDK